MIRALILRTMHEALSPENGNDVLKSLNPITPQVIPREKVTHAMHEARGTLENALLSLTHKQKMYAESRLSGMRPIAAARAAGIAHADTNAYNYEKHPAIRAAIEAGNRITAQRLELNRDDIVEGMMDAVRSAGTAMELVAAWREIGKLMGAYEPLKVAVEHSIQDMTLNKLQQMSDRQLAEMAGMKESTIDADDPLAAEYTDLGDAISKPVPIDYGTDEAELVEEVGDAGDG